MTHLLFTRSARQTASSLATCMALWTAVALAPPALAQTGAIGNSEAESRPDSAPHEKVGSGVPEAIARDGRAAVIVALDQPERKPARRGRIPALVEEVGRMQQAVLGALQPRDFRATHVYDAVPALAGWVTAPGLERLARHPDVLRVDLDARGSGSLADSVPHIGAADWHDEGTDGNGVTIAVLDTGVDTDHPDLQAALASEECFLERVAGDCPDGTGRQSGPGAAEDGHGHGTHVSGIALSRGQQSSDGVAPAANLVALKVIDDNDRFWVSDLLTALSFLITDLPDLQVVNMSLGTNATFEGACDEMLWNVSLAWAVDTLRALGVTPIAASGNDDPRPSMTSPACLSPVVSVGATDDADNVSSHTDVSPELDLMAPGVGIESSAVGGGTVPMTGTSMAAPHASGCAALLLQSGFASTPDEVEAWLTTSQVSVQAAGLEFPRLECLPPDHFLCYETPQELLMSSVVPGTFVELEDRFDRALGRTELREVTATELFCNPVEKIHGDSVSARHHPDHHLTFYRLEPSADSLDWVIQVENQFGVQELEIFDPALLAVPTQKEPHDPPVGLDHYRCYNALGSFLPLDLVLNDQFQEGGELFDLFPFLFCNPVRKTHGEMVTEIRKPGEHLVCYFAEASIQLDPPVSRLLTSQFGSWEQELESANVLCVPSTDVSSGSESTGSVTVCKDLVPDDGSLWDVTLHGPTTGFASALGEEDCHVLDDLRPGEYELQEVIPPSVEGLYSTSVACTNGASGGASVVLGVVPGAAITCTFTNTPEWSPGPGNCDSVHVTGLDVTLSAMDIQACRELRAGPDVSVGDSGDLHLAAGDRVILGDGLQIGDGGSLRVSSCGHDLCQAAPDPLADGCHPCVNEVCTVDPVCCTGAWDDRCVDLVESVCKLRCP